MSISQHEQLEMSFKRKPLETLFSNTFHSLLVLSSAKNLEEIHLASFCHWTIIESVISLIMNNKQCAAGTAGRKHVHDCNSNLIG